MRVLVTGGAGFIGSHQLVSLHEAGHETAVVDNLSNSLAQSIDNVGQLTNQETSFHQFDLRDTERLELLLQDFEPEAVIHFAGMKHVGESTSIPRDYHDCNVGGLLSLLRAAEKTSLRKIVFSSSGSVYGETSALPIVERHPHAPSNPYSASKSYCERILADLCQADESWSAVALRYFNPAGAHPSGHLGEWCLGPPSNLLPRLIEVAYGDDPVVQVHGNDFATPDGTGVRDYVHVVDVAESHLRALNIMTAERTTETGFEAINIGRGRGVSVLELVRAVEKASGKELKVQIGPRRSGDVSALYGDTTLAESRLGVMQYQGLDAICADAWQFKVKNPTGYATV